MACYHLTSGWALRGWQDLPACLVHLSAPQEKPHRLKLSDFSLLDRCDGAHDLPDSPALGEFLDKGVIEPGTEPVSEEQRYQLYPWVHRAAVRISITDRCQYRCRHCYAGDASGRMVGEISPELFSSLTQQMEDMGISQMKITGGEPLLHPHLMQMLECLPQHGIRLTELFTNGAALTEDFLDRLTDLGQRPLVQVSFDGFGVHDWMRGAAGAEESALRAMRLLQKKGFPIQVGMNVNGRTAPVTVESCRRLARDFHPSFYIYYTSPSARWLACSSPEDRLSVGDYFDLCIELSRTCVTEQWGTNMRMFQFPNLTDRTGFQKYCESLHTSLTLSDYTPLMNCPEACSMVHITSDGRVLPCSGYEGTSRVEGFLNGEDISIWHHSLQEILTESSYLQPFCSTIGDLKKKEPSCAGCSRLSHCRGGCRLLSLDRIRSHVEHDHKSEIQCLFFHGGYAERYETVMTEAFRQAGECGKKDGTGI